MSKKLIKFKNTFGDIINIKAQPGLVGIIIGCKFKIVRVV